MSSIRFFILFLFSSAFLLSQPCYLFTGEGKDPSSFHDPLNWAPKAKDHQGIPAELSPGSGQYRYSLHIFKPIELKIGLAGPRSFSEALYLVHARLTIDSGHSLSFLNSNKHTNGRKIGNNIQGESTITLEPHASLTFEGNVYLDKYRHNDPVPWIVLKGASLIIKGSTSFLAGEIKLSGNAFFSAESVNFGRPHNTGTINFASGSKAKVQIKNIIWDKNEADYSRLIRSRNILIDGNPARDRDFKVENGILSLAK